MNDGNHDDEKLVRFPNTEREARFDRLPRDIGKMPDNHPFRRPVAIIILAVVLMLVGHMIWSFSTGQFDTVDVDQFDYAARGTLTYNDEDIRGYYMDEEHEHFLSLDGREFTYINEHTRRGNIVSGHWRLVDENVEPPPPWKWPNE